MTGAAVATPKPSAKQVYCLAHLMADALGLDWPADRQSASDTIKRLMALKAQSVDARAAGGKVSDDIPF